MPATSPPDSSIAILHSVDGVDSSSNARFVNAAEFRQLIVSNRRMERADKLAPKMRGLRDLETGELFLTEERWLLEGKR